MTGSDRHAALTAEYAEVSDHFRLLTDIRFKLLALLPLVAAAAAVFNSRSVRADRLVQAQAFGIALFGLVVTIAVVTYNARNDQIYVELVHRAAAIERELGIPDGVFSQRPSAWFDLGRRGTLLRWHIGHVSAVRAIYCASIALWMFGCLLAAARFAWGASRPPSWLFPVLLVIAGGVAAAGIVVVGNQRRARREQLGRRAPEAVAIVRAAFAHANWRAQLRDDQTFREICSKLIGGERKPNERENEVDLRLEYYADMSDEEFAPYVSTTPSRRDAENFVGLITDLPLSIVGRLPRRR